MSDRGLNRAYLSLGSNIEPEANLPAAVRAISSYGQIRAVSRAWESAPFGLSSEARSEMRADDFLNGAVLLETDLSAGALCVDIVPSIENRLGRIRDLRDKNAPRTIDIDLSLFNDEVLTAGRRTIPDPDLLTRPFVAIPLAELDPDYVHPTDGRTLAQIAAQWGAKPPLRLRTDVVLR
jgi:2-amino-4-hydroxy-6-hydroxymethyldihydropteridine diphosphokinase